MPSTTSNPVAGNNVSSFPNYKADRRNGLALFIGRLHSPESIAAEEYLEVETLSFRLCDNIASSGLLELLQGKLWPRLTHFPQMPIKFTNMIQVTGANSGTATSRPAGDLGVAFDMCQSLLENYDNAGEIPARKWFQVIVWLLRRCVNVKMIEVPPQWEFVRWYAPRFPAVDQARKRWLWDGRWLWGEDPVVAMAMDI